MKITISQENSSPIEIEIAERSNEGLFFNKKRVCYSYDDYFYAWKTPLLAIKHLIAANTGLSDTGTNPSDMKDFVINKKYENKLKEVHELKYIEVDLKVKENKRVFEDQYGGEHHGTTIKVEKDTLINFAKTYGIKYTIKDTSSLASKRKKEYAALNKIVSAVLTKFNSYKGFKIAEREKEDIDNFLSGESGRYALIDWDAWAGTDNHARDDEAYDAFMKRYTEICNEIKSMISVAGLNGKIDDDGDWDDGIIVYYSND